jgi:PAS domain S-box-containing protein
MDCEHKLKVLEQEIESLKEENRLLKEKLSSSEKNFDGVSFKEKYAVRILDSLPDMLTVFNHEEMGIEVVSNEETNHVGVSNNDFKGMRMQDMVPKEAYHNIHNNLQKVISTGRGSTAHHELDVDGTLHYYENRIFPLDEEYVLIMCRDISERVATQQNLEIFKRILDRVSDSILAVSVDGTLVYANRQFIEEYGVKGELGTQKIYDLPVSLNTKEQFDKRVQEIRDNGGNFAYRAKYTRVGETKLRVHQVSAFMIQNQGEEMIWFFTQDITDVIKNRDELRELNYLMDAILNNIPVYLFVKDPEDDFRYLYWNKAFASHSKIPASKALGRTDFEVFPEYENAEKFHRDDLELIRTRERMEMQETYVTATGETRIVQTLKTLVPLEGRAPLIIGISWDITNMQNIEQELVQARIKAEQSDRLKTAFLANMSHEIRTPLNAIVGFSRLMTIADNAEDEKLYSDIINQNSEILLQLINDILDLAKIEAGTLEYIRYPMDLGELCRNVYEMHKDRVQTGVVLILDNKDTSLIINEDQNRIMQVVTNLITNAIKFTFKGEIRFGFEVREEYIDFYVKDTGMGISEEKIKMIFERFVKLNTFVQGTGLGLAICRVIVEKLGGEITAESKLNEGSTFRFTIPYKAGKKIPESGKAMKCPESGSTGPRKVLQRRTVLVAEDVDSNFLLLKTLLGKRCNLLWAKNGEDAVNQFKEHQPDLILMDIKMPHMDGLEATRLIRSYSKEVPIVALTAFAFESDKDRAIEAGCDDFLTKPVSQNALEKVLDKYVK